MVAVSCCVVVYSLWDVDVNQRKCELSQRRCLSAGQDQVTPPIKNDGMSKKGCYSL